MWWSSLVGALDVESRNLVLAMALLVVTLVGNSQTLLSFLLSPGFQHHIKWVWRYMPVMYLQAVCYCLFFWDKVPLCSTGYPGTHSVDQAGLQIRDSAASASWVLGLKSRTITDQLKIIFMSDQPGMHKTLSQKTTNNTKAPASSITVVSLRWLYYSSVSSSHPGAIVKKKKTG